MAASQVLRGRPSVVGLGISREAFNLADLIIRALEYFQRKAIYAANLAKIAGEPR